MVHLAQWVRTFQVDLALAGERMRLEPKFLFDLDGTLVDSVYQHVRAWREASDAEGIELSIWRIHRKIGISGGLFTDLLFRSTGLERSGAARVYEDPADLLEHVDEVGGRR